VGFFAVTSRNELDNFDVEACHLSFWVLPTFLVWSKYCFDVGLRIKAKADLRRFGVVLPFRAERGDLKVAGLKPGSLNCKPAAWFVDGLIRGGHPAFLASSKAPTTWSINGSSVKSISMNLM
jgi:hypothetical protein